MDQGMNFDELFTNDLIYHMIEMISLIEEGNYPETKVASFLESFDIDFCFILKSLAQFYGYIETASIIEKANQINMEKKVSKFKSAIASQQEEQWLSTLSWEEKCALQAAISNEESLTEEEKEKINQTIDFSIDQDLLKEAKKEGFSSIQKWQEYHNMVDSEERKLEKAQYLI